MTGQPPLSFMKRLYFIPLLFVSLSLFAQISHRPKVALVLGGGGAKGAAEVGVLKYIEQSGVPIDMIVGTSIGSIVGGLYAAGYSSAQLDSLFRNQEWLDLLTDRNAENVGKFFAVEDGQTYLMGFPINLNFKRKDGSKFRLGALRGDSIVSTLERMTRLTDSIHFDALPIPFRCVAVDVGTFEEVVLSSGSLAQAMRASMAIPLAFRPMLLNDRTLIDGGVLNNLPVDVAKEMGADVVIAVDLTVNKHEGQGENADAWDMEEGGWFSALDKLGVLSAAQWALSRPDRKKYRSNRQLADIYINPNLRGYGAHSFTPHKISEMISLGEEAGKESLKSLKSLRKQLDKYKK